MKDPFAGDFALEQMPRPVVKRGDFVIAAARQCRSGQTQAQFT